MFKDESCKITILLADDHPLMRLALRNVLEKQDDFEVVSEVEDGEEAIRVAKELVPNVAIIDISMPKLNGLEATRSIKAECPDVGILILTVHSDIEHLLGVFEAGADGYLTKSVFGPEVVHAVRALAAGDAVLCRDVLRKVVEYALKYPIKALPLGEIENLTVQEVRMLHFAAMGMTNKEIAQELGLSFSTIKNYFANIFSKLQASSRTEAVAIGVRAGIITLD